MDAITLLKADHRTVEDLFRRFEQAGRGATRTRRDLVDRIVTELSVHAEIEETVFYPAVRQVPELEPVVLAALEEHHVVKWLVSELDGMDPEHERFEAKTMVLIENVSTHVEEEENDFFPLVRGAMGRAELNDLGEALAKAKGAAPTHPHPRSPDSPPGNLVTGAVAAVLDRARDAGETAVRRAASGLG